jgi:Replicative DNA helicase
MTKDDIKNELPGYLSAKAIDIEKSFRCLNPNHADNNPSMKLDPKRNKVHCFACGADYDIFDIIGIDYGIADNKAKFKKTYEIFNVTFQKREENLSQFFKEAHSHIHETDYLALRGISDAVCKRFMIGYVRYWRHPKAPQNTPVSPRMIIPTGENSYLARDTRYDLSETEKKYSKSKVGKVQIFNKEVLKTADKPVFIVEGEIDALSIIEAGGEAVALGSISNIQKLVDLLKGVKPQKPLIIALDNDNAGQNASVKLCDALQTLEVPFYRCNPCGDYKDANEALMRSGDVFRNEVRNAEHTQGNEYLKNSTTHYLQDFINGIADSVNTSYISTGFKKLDEVLDGGLYEGLYIIGAISSLGKTTLINQIADQAAQMGTDILFVSLEMARNEIIAKSISRHTLRKILTDNGDIRHAKTVRGITAGKRYQHYSEEEKHVINKSIKAYAEYSDHIYIIEGMGDIGTDQIRDAVSKHISFTGNTPVVLIDYLQILAPHNERGTDKQNTDKAVMELKRISRDFKTPVIGISSFNRANYREAVTMEAFKESGAVEYSSDVLIGLQLAGAGKKDFDVNIEKKRDPRQIELVILKNRNGKTGDKIEYNYYPMFNYFLEK